MSKWHSWNSNGDDFATVAGITAAESIWLAPLGGRELRKGPVRLRVVIDERGVLPLGDFPHTGLQQPRLLSRQAWSLLGEQLASCGRYVSASVDGDGNDYHLWWPTVVADCLDEDASRIFESLGGYRKIVKPCFVSGKVPLDTPFTIKGFEHQDVWIDEAFKKRIESAGLSGAEFRMTARIAKKG